MENWNGIVSLLIACIELVLIVNLLFFAEKDSLNKLAVTIIILLAVYQTLEFLMCHFGFTYSVLAYLAFVDISFLPPLNLFFILSLYGLKISYKNLIFLPAITFLIFYTTSIPQFEVVSCTVMYASFNYPLGTLYGIFYYAPLLISLAIIIYKIKKESENRKKIISKILLSGHLIIMLPVVIAFVLAFYNFHALLKIIESIMCKFALFYALSLSIIILYRSRNNE